MSAAARTLTVQPLAGGAPAQRRGATGAQRQPAPSGPGRRAMLEARWRARLERVTELSLAFHEAAAAEPARASRQPGPALRRLMRQAVSARQELADTDEALGRLSAGRYGRCESCARAISPQTLHEAPEARYCSSCVQQPA